MLSKRNEDILFTLIDMDKRDALKGCFSDIPIEVYHDSRMPGYSSSYLKTILSRSFAHAEVERKQKDCFRFGNAFHTWVNEPHLWESSYYVVQTTSKRTTEWRQAKTLAGSRIMLTFDEFQSIQKMANRLFSHPIASLLLKNASFEHTFFSRDCQTGLLKRVRVDILNSIGLTDLKSTLCAAQDSFAFDCRKFNYRLSAAYYTDVVYEATNKLYDKFHLIACEKLEPWESAVYWIDSMSLASGATEYRSALDRIHDIQTGKQTWKGYSLETKLISI